MGLDSSVHKIGTGEDLGEELLYWRKFNAIHKWFCDNCEVIEVNIGYIVTRENLMELMKVLQDVAIKPERAKELLPTQEGCFFGGTDYDDWYFEYVKGTIPDIFEVLQDHKDEKFIYVGNW